MPDDPLRVVLCWHMHQPEYRNPDTGAFVEPWLLLHGLKDYTDMAAHLEDVPEARAVVNFSPLVLDQLEALVAQLDEALAGGALPKEPLLAGLLPGGLPGDRVQRHALMAACLRAPPERMVARHKPLARLSALARAALAEHGAEDWLSEAFLGDLVAWYLLAWLGESVRTGDARAERLLGCEHGLTLTDRRELATLVRDTLAGIAPRWRALAEAGQVELACNPWAHPMLPLLLDFASAREARPDTPLPESGYPGGALRVRWHLEQARATHAARFGSAPMGCWPSEGGVSDGALDAIAEAGFAWAATGQQVLHHSLAGKPPAGGDHRPYRVASHGLPTFFRDDGLSDNIGFVYQDWSAEEAVADFIGHLETIAADADAEPGRVVPVVLDGENAWEYYHHNAWHFLNTLYRRLVEHPRIQLTTFGDCIEDAAVPQPALEHVVAGSWVFGDFNTWIGDPQKNRAWELLIAARAALEEAIAQGAEFTPELARRLAVCEGSDWFWWPGEYNPAESVASFDVLFRHQLAGLYTGVGLQPPPELGRRFAHGGGDPAAGGVMRGG
jgi:alpha-amylase/alpha-mannosidase (GH57 family)